MLRIRLLNISLLAATFLISACDNASKPVSALQKTLDELKGEQVWVETLPVQCLRNPWEKEWVSENGGNYPKDKEREILLEFFQKRGVSFSEYRAEWIYDAVCLACSCPEGYVIFLKINADDFGVFEANGFQLSGANLELQTDKSRYQIDETITFQLSNPTILSFSANGQDQFGEDLLVARGSDFVVQQWQNDYWMSVELPQAIEGTQEFEITAASQFQGSWFNHKELTGKFRLYLQVALDGDESKIGHVISEPFVISDSLVSFDPTPRAVDFGDPYDIDSEKTFLSGDTLNFQISHAGGCEVHDYAVYLNRVEDLTAYLFINHNANGDLCEAYLTHNLQSNLQELLVRDDFSGLVLLTPAGEAIVLR